MFWRLFVSYLVLVAAAVGLVGLITLRRNWGEPGAWSLVTDVLIAAGFIAAAAVAPAYVIARRLTRPLNDLTAAAMRLADGDLGHAVRAAGTPEVAALARTLNLMRERLAGSFARVAHDTEQLRTILSGMVEGVVALDDRLKLLFANDRAGELLEFNPQAAVGRKLWEVTRQRAVQELVAKALADGGPHRQELDWLGADSKSLTAYVSRLPGPGAAGLVMVLHDTTEVRRLERLRQDFVANVSHELKTPLAVIRSNVEALQDGAADDPLARGPFLDRAQHEVARLDALIRDLLRLAKIEAGEQVLTFAPVRLDEAIAECLDRHATRAEEKTIQFVEVPPADAPPGAAAWADEQAVGHILDNLVDNAIKYTAGGGRITVRWGATNGQTWVDVQDTGIGIGEADLKRVFERFYRADKARGRDAGGTGLGLAIVKHLAAVMNGRVAVRSELGTGTTFRVTLPRAGG